MIDYLFILFNYLLRGLKYEQSFSPEMNVELNSNSEHISNILQVQLVFSNENQLHLSSFKHISQHNSLLRTVMVCNTLS